MMQASTRNCCRGALPRRGIDPRGACGCWGHRGGEGELWGSGRNSVGAGGTSRRWRNSARAGAPRGGRGRVGPPALLETTEQLLQGFDLAAQAAPAKDLALNDLRKNLQIVCQRKWRKWQSCFSWEQIFDHLAAFCRPWTKGMHLPSCS